MTAFPDAVPENSPIPGCTLPADPQPCGQCVVLEGIVGDGYEIHKIKLNLLKFFDSKRTVAARGCADFLSPSVLSKAVHLKINQHLSKRCHKKTHILN